MGEDIKTDKANEEQGEPIRKNGFMNGLAEADRSDHHERERESLSNLRETPFKHKNSP
jgi:hypothetical protein